MQLILLWKIEAFLIFKISWQYINTCSGWEHQLTHFHYLIDQGAEYYYIPVTNRIVLCTGEFENKAMFCTVTYFNCEVQNMLLF